MARQQKTAGRVAFLAHREAIWAELAKGWSVSSVHRQFAAVVPIGLRQFQLYVMRYLVEKTLPRFVSLAEASGGNASDAAKMVTEAPTPPIAEPDARPRGFHRISKPNSNDIY